MVPTAPPLPPGSSLSNDSPGEVQAATAATEMTSAATSIGTVLTGGIVEAPGQRLTRVAVDWLPGVLLAFWLVLAGYGLVSSFCDRSTELPSGQPIARPC